MCIVTGPRIELAIELIKRLKSLFLTINIATFEYWIVIAMSYKPADKREKRLRNLGDLLDNINRSDMTHTMGYLSLEFYRQAALAEGYFHGDQVGNAEGHRLIAEAINNVLKTLEAKRREAVEVMFHPFLRILCRQY